MGYQITYKGDREMKTYKARFYGRTINAIGIFYWIEVEVQGENEEQARLNLYEKYDHISRLTLSEKEGSISDK